MIYGYARCSTNEELQAINRQIRELKQLGALEESIFREYESGMKNDRVELQRLLSAVEAGDTIVATEVSRITRSTKQLCEIIELAKDRHIKLVLGSFWAYSASWNATSSASASKVVCRMPKPKA